jgi:anthranilate/para-aminobenzoate synthase component I
VWEYRLQIGPEIFVSVSYFKKVKKEENVQNLVSGIEGRT